MAHIQNDEAHTSSALWGRGTPEAPNPPRATEPVSRSVKRANQRFPASLGVQGRRSLRAERGPWRPVGARDSGALWSVELPQPRRPRRSRVPHSPAGHLPPLPRLAQRPGSAPSPPPRLIRCAPVAPAPPERPRSGPSAVVPARLLQSPRDGAPAAAAAQESPPGRRLPARPGLGPRVQAREADRQGRLQPLLQADRHVHQRCVCPQGGAVWRRWGRVASSTGKGGYMSGPCLQVEREIALHSRLRHRNIVAFHGHFADREHVYMVLEYCSHQSLAHVLRARQTLTEPEVRYYLRGLVSGLRYLHQRHIIHRDLKLSNFFLNKNMEVKIGDLGLAAKVGPGGRCHGVLCGTPNFLAPEVVSRNGHSCQSDIWALGCIMYTVLTGTPPFMASPLSEMYQNIREGHYPEPTHLSANARRLIARLLAPNPAERPSLDHLLQDDFFTEGFTPDRLPAHSCHSPPIFATPPPLGRIFRKVGQRLLTQCWPPCPFTPKEASGPGEGGPDPDSMEWHGESSLSSKEFPCLEGPIHLVARGTLQSNLAGPEGSQRPEVEAALRHLQLCLDAGPPATQDPLGEQQRILWAPKWVDYSSKYGFGYQLSDGGSGVLLRDGTHMALRPPGGGCRSMERCPLAWAAQDRGPVSSPQPSVLQARPWEAGNLHPEGCARPAGRQAGRAAALCRLPAAAAAGGESWGAGEGEGWGRPLCHMTSAESVHRRGPSPHLCHLLDPASASCASWPLSKACCCCSAMGWCR
ncbi:inactive serine/threonine-protein kinase PLK5 isoform X2 [Nomascus leucogenys]|uniref:inactive serine/threonine-protein kinase PLK5 isoform X2 n=1 Tax=Nomascus leucogenys TaxID=61853 RepID=UPI00122D6162|nr:inactive serine/threonine-protein kinase PLK5 isoform X2 [Nomascus leucogenys]